MTCDALLGCECQCDRSAARPGGDDRMAETEIGERSSEANGEGCCWIHASEVTAGGAGAAAILP